MERLKNIAIIVPSLNPDEKLASAIYDLHDAGFEDIIMVNDGSGDEYLHYFDELQNLPYVTRLDHKFNMGKGAALRTAFTFLQNNRKDLVGAITVDSDGQHQIPDVLKCADALNAYNSPECTDTMPLILGVRDFSLSGIPARSVFGNRMTSVLFRILFGLKISDTQTGLRGIAAEYIPYFIKTTGNRYEYETNMLLETKTFGIPIKEIPINTVYIDNNATSHFHPIRDSIRIYALILKFLFSSILSFVVDIGIFDILVAIFKLVKGTFITNYAVIIATVGARIVSSLVNFFTNKKIVFASKESRSHTLLKYYALCIPQMFVSGFLVWGITKLLGDGTFLTTLIKIVVDTVLFFINFRIQREWVFAKKKKSK